jgi:D-arabinose 1-dehydrogenase-like Zn-dependent alcohol dehydrogenase
MKVRVLQTTGDGSFTEVEWEKPDITADEIEVTSVMTGVCRSDIDMMNGKFGPLPVAMQGHEGLGKVTKVGANITNITVGAYVATRGEPAYADYYNVRRGEFVKVPKAEPKYILEPVACGINLILQNKSAVAERAGAGKRMLILGSGFLAWVAYNTVKLSNYQYSIDVVGSSNTAMWLGAGESLFKEPNGAYDVVIDLSNSDIVFRGACLNNNALVILASEKHPKVTTDFSQLLWKSCIISCPSPRNPQFIESMEQAVAWVSSGQLVVDRFWSKGYARDKDWQAAFSEGNLRIPDYGRGYIYWEKRMDEANKKQVLDVITKNIKSARRWIWVTFQKVGFHKYPAAASEASLHDVRYLSSKHRHLFKFKVQMEIFHSDRELEFHQVLNYCESLFTTQTIDIDSKSVEMLADDLYTKLAEKYPARGIKINVSEDGECGCWIDYESPNDNILYSGIRVQTNKR